MSGVRTRVLWVIVGVWSVTFRVYICVGSVLCHYTRSHQVFPIWNDVWWYKVEFASVEHVVDPPLCWDLDLVGEGSHDPLYFKGAILEGV